MLIYQSNHPNSEKSDQEPEYRAIRSRTQVNRYQGKYTNVEILRPEPYRPSATAPAFPNPGGVPGRTNDRIGVRESRAADWLAGTHSDE
jgi:hypothetical protein